MSQGIKELQEALGRLDQRRSPIQFDGKHHLIIRRDSIVLAGDFDEGRDLVNGRYMILVGTKTEDLVREIDAIAGNR